MALLSSAGTSPPSCQPFPSQPMPSLANKVEEEEGVHMTREGCLAHLSGKSLLRLCSSEPGTTYDQEGLATSKAGDCTNLV